MVDRRLSLDNLHVQLLADRHQLSIDAVDGADGSGGAGGAGGADGAGGVAAAAAELVPDGFQSSDCLQCSLLDYHNFDYP